MTNCKVSLTVSREAPRIETSATCELTCDGDEEAGLSAQQIRFLQDVCLAAVRTQQGLASRFSSGPGSVGLRQLGRLYRAAGRIPSFDVTHLQQLSRRLYQKSLNQLSLLEVAGMTSTLKAVVQGTLDAKEVFHQPASAASAINMNGRASKC